MVQKGSGEKKTAEGLVSFAIEKIGTPYVYGAKGEKLTQALLTRLIKENPDMYTTAYIKKVQKNMQKTCVDCSGLISWYTGIVRGSAGYCETAKKKVKISELNESMKGWALWKKNHIGIYVGGGKCVEAKGVDYGVIKSDVKATAWEYAIKLTDINYELSPAPSYVQTVGWHDTTRGWMYFDTPTTYKKDCWMNVADGAYRFDATGVAKCQSWYTEDGARYYFGADCRVMTGMREVEQKIYVFDSMGRADCSPHLTILYTAQDGELIPMKSYGGVLAVLGKLLGGKK